MGARRVPGISLLLALALALAAAGCGRSSAEHGANPAAGFVDVAAEVGIRHVHEKPVLDPQLDNIGPWMSSVGAAVAAGDFDNDGWIDLYVTRSRKGTANLLYRNNGDGTFRDVAAAAGVDRVNDDGGVSMDCIWADLDNDGWSDLYVVRWGRDVVYHNNGDGTFSDVTAKLFRTADGRPGAPWANGNAVIAVDYDRDGRLDLYVGNYFREVDLWALASTRIMHDSFEIARNAGRNFLYRQQADGTFREVAAELGLDDPGWTLAVGAGDLDNDGWPDVYVANDFGPDQIFVNDRRGGFVNVSDKAIGEDTRKGMNVDFGDFNNDGWIDIYVTNITTAEYLQEGNMLWRNNGPDADGLPRFMDISPESATYDGGWGWGGKFLDHDNDGDLDIFTVNGFVSAGTGSYWYDLASWTVQDDDPADSRNWPPMGDRSFSGYEKFRLFRNDGHETFAEVAAELGVASDRDGRGIAVVDYDNDGDLDIFVANQGQPPQLYRNELPAGAGWLTLRLIGDPATGANADAVGARVTVVAGGLARIRDRDGGTGYSGQSDPRLHFGLGEAATIELVEVRWPDGGLQYLENVERGRIVTVKQDPAQYAARSRTEAAAPVPRLREGDAPVHLVPQIEPAELDRMLATLETALAERPGDHALARDYRRRCVDYGQHDRAIEFFKTQVQRAPASRWARLELSVAYVDKIPTCGGLAAIVCKGTLARRSLDQVDAVLERDGDDWLARYARGMNHLHWPRALRHSAAAIADFTRCLELKRNVVPTRPWHERVFVLLGDAHAKNGSFDEARRIWELGRREFPDSAALGRRAELGDAGAALEFVQDQRSLEQPIDTDLSFLDGVD